jgi:hypothetical protein
MFGVGDLTVFARPVVAAPVDKGPTFPLYLLPSFNVPFRRRRPKSSYFDPQPESPSETSVPSLSSSPDSLSGVETPETPDSPISLRPFLTKLPALGDSHDKPNARKRRLLLFLSGPRVARTQPDTIRCSTCATDIAFSSQIVSKGFTGRHGRAFLIAPPSLAPTNTAAPLADLINITVGRPETRQLVTGLHSVADIWCAVCGTKLGWKYVDAREPSQKYKVGKFILETTRVALHQTWEDVGSSATTVRKGQPRGGTRSTSARSSTRSSSETNTDTTASSSYAHDEDDDIIVFDSEDEDECDDIFAGVWDAETVVKRRKSKVAQMRKKR